MANQNDKQDQARNLYFQTNLTQAQIAELIGISQKTVSFWMNEGKWKLLKERAQQAPVILIEQMVCELQEIHSAIAARPVGERFATRAEAEIHRKTMLSIKSLQEQQTAGVHSEMLTNFISYVCRRDVEGGKYIMQYADQYLKGEMKFSPQPQYKDYRIPGDIEINEPQPPSGDQPQGDNLNKAA